jgi:high-affinity Fe2+/Pb2+ permease
MTTAEIIFILFVAAILLVWAAWMFAPRHSRFMQFWIDLTGRRTAGPPSTRADDR